MDVDSTGVAPIGTSSIISPLLPEKESTLNSNYSVEAAGNQNENESIGSNGLRRRDSIPVEHDVNDVRTPPQPLQVTQPRNRTRTAQSVLINFVLFSILFSANHGAVVSCISLASARLGDIGTTQNSVLYLSYTLSALLGSTLVINPLGCTTPSSLGCSSTVYISYPTSLLQLSHPHLF